MSDKKRIVFALNTDTEQIKYFTQGFKGDSCMKVHSLLEDLLIDEEIETTEEYNPEFEQDESQMV